LIARLCVGQADAAREITGGDTPDCTAFAQLLVRQVEQIGKRFGRKAANAKAHRRHSAMGRQPNSAPRQAPPSDPCVGSGLPKRNLTPLRNGTNALPRRKPAQTANEVHNAAVPILFAIWPAISLLSQEQIKLVKMVSRFAFFLRPPRITVFCWFPS